VANRTKFTPKRRAKFIAELAKYPNVTAAASVIGMSTVQLYHLKKRIKKFGTEWDTALNIGVKACEDEAHRRAFNGVDEPVFYQGVPCGSIRKYSDTLAMFLLKAHEPERFRDR
jgi:hypothetical protein